MHRFTKTKTKAGISFNFNLKPNQCLHLTGTSILINGNFVLSENNCSDTKLEGNNI